MKDSRVPAHLKHHAGFLQQICPHVGANDPVPVVKANLDVLAEATAVIIAGRLGVSNSLKKKKKVKLNKSWW